MFKRKTTLLLALLFAGTLLGAGALPMSQAKAEEEETITLASEDGTLFIPSTYEQYLPLQNPVSFAMSDEYIAIADGSTLFLFDRSTGKYVSPAYSHISYENGTEPESISKVQIAEVNNDADRIFFSDAHNHLYEYAAGKSSKELIVNNVTAQTFLIDNENGALFTASASTESGSISLTRYSLSNGFESSTATQTIVAGKSPNLTLGEGHLHVSYNENTLAIYDAETLTLTKNSYLDENNSIAGLQSVCAFNGALFYTVKDNLVYGNGLFMSRDGEATHLSLGENEDDGMSALGVYGGEMYCIRNKALRKLSVQEDENGNVAASYADYEICSASATVGRLSGATDAVRAGDLLLLSDTGNNRITIVNVSDPGSPAFETIENIENISCAATDGTLIAVAHENEVLIYAHPQPHAEGYVLAGTCTATNNITGLTCVNGVCYFVTGGKGYGSISVERNFSEPGANPSFTVHSGVIVRDLLGSPRALASDLYGSLYVAYEDTTVHSFTEEQFVVQSEQGTTLEGVNIPNNATSLRADFEGNLYYLGNDHAVYRNGETTPFAKINGANFVYSETEKSPVSFALGFEDDEVYFLFGDFVVRSNAGALGFPTLGTISSEGVSVSEVRAKEAVELADVEEGCVGIRVDLSSFEESEYFPYVSYSRTDGRKRAVVLGGTADGKYKLVATYESKSYTVELFRAEDILPEAPRPVWTGESGRRYFASSAYAYNYPCITAARTAGPLPRGTEAKLLDVLHAEGENGLDFAYIEYQTEARARVRGYVPLSFLSETDPSGAASERFGMGTLKESLTFSAADGSSLTVEAGEQVRLYDNGDGTFTARVTKDGVEYEAQVQSGMVMHGESDALRIALIVILTVLAIVIVAAYFFLISGKKKRNLP